ncbi:MAG TPA: serine/threonine-protein kinase [Polyangiaceae bacterium]
MERLAPEDLVEEWSDLSASSLGPGARLGRYELLIPVAYGGMARVWAARQHGQRGFQKTVAIKTILPHLAHNPEFERMFLDEARIAAGVHHPNVCEIYELGEEGHVLYLAMEWVSGDSLVHVLKGLVGKQVVPIEVRVASRIVADACAGLHAAHELCDEDGKLLNVVHRDISPHNILVSLEGTVKVADFGVAKAYGQMHQATMAGQVKGKVAYMSPEQIGGTSQFDRRADIFAMGCVLYETTTGVLPFRGGNDPQVMQAVLKGTYEHPSKLIKGYPPELATIIDRALAPEPRMRFATAERMRVALEEWLAKTGSVVTATQVGSLVRQRLGPELDKRRDHVKAAIAMLQGGDSGPKSVQQPGGAGHTPSRPQSGSHTGQSHSGVVSTGQQPALPPPLPAMRGPSNSVPHAPSPAYAPAIAPPTRPALPVLPATAAAPSGTKYAMAAIGGVAFALIVGGVALALWLALRPHGDAATAVPEPTARPSVSAVVAPPPAPSPLPTVAASSSAAPPAPVAEQPPAPAPATPTIDVTDLPTAAPTFRAPPPPYHPAPSPAPGPAPTNKPVALPANPY